jgi:hypothetical protein
MTKSVFTDGHLQLMAQVLDRIIPPSDSFKGAGELGVADNIHGMVRGSAKLIRNFNRGLRAIQINSNERFASLSDAAKDNVLRAVEAQNPKFFDELLEQTYRGYYANREIVAILGCRTPQSVGTGDSIGSGSLELLGKVRQRGRIFRDS